MSVIDPRALILEDIVPGTVVAIYGQTGSGRTMLARRIARQSIRSGRKILVVTVSPMIHDGTHWGYADIPHSAVTPDTPHSTDADVVIYDRALEDPTPNVLAAVSATGRTVIVVAPHPQFAAHAHIVVATSRITRRGYETYFGVPAPAQLPVMPHFGAAYVARRGEEPVIIPFPPL